MLSASFLKVGESTWTSSAEKRQHVLWAGRGRWKVREARKELWVNEGPGREESLNR